MDSKSKRLNDPYIGIAGIARGMLDYNILIRRDGIPSIKTRIEESYEEALKAMQNH